MKKYLKIITISLGILLVFIVGDYGYHRLSSSVPLVSVNTYENSSYEVYNAIGYKVWKCKYGDKGSIIHTGTYFSEYICPDDMPYTIVNEEKNSCQGFGKLLYEDDSYIYYSKCQQEGYIKYENGETDSIKDALDSGNININELEKNGLELDKEPIKLNNIEVIVSNKCEDKLQDIYEFEGSKVFLYCIDKFDITFKFDETLSLKDALHSGKITIPEIIEYLEFTAQYAEVSKEVYRDGGSIMYSTFTYSLLRCNKIDGNKNIVIGPNSLDINDGYCE